MTVVKQKPKSVSKIVEPNQQKSVMKKKEVMGSIQVAPKNEEAPKKKEKKRKPMKMYKKAAKPKLVRDLRGNLDPGKCDTWQEILYWEAHWDFFFGAIFLAGISIVSLLITLFFAGDYLPKKASLRVEMVFVIAMIIHIHIWCLARLALETQKLLVFKIVFEVSVYTTVAIGVGIPVVSMLVGHYSLLLYSYVFVATITLIQMTFVIFKITFKPNPRLLSSKMQLYLRELRREKRNQDILEGKVPEFSEKLEEMVEEEEEKKPEKPMRTNKDSIVEKAKARKAEGKLKKAKEAKEARESNLSRISSVSIASSVASLPKSSKSNASATSKAST